MCGIVGYIGREAAAPILLDGLQRLEYRGYDSAGIAVHSEQNGLQIVKTKGRLQALVDIVSTGKPLTGTMGIGHTRWATHGEPSDENSHPHVSEDGRIAVVHNGIIENYIQIKEFLQGKGVQFRSQTDTEVIAHLLEYYYDGDILQAVASVLHIIEGSYALGIICAEESSRLIAARKDSPLILGYSEKGSFLASDVTAIIRHTRDVSYMEDGEIAVLDENGIRVFNTMLESVEKEHSFVDWEVSAAEKGGYEHFMFKEIMEQPEAIRKTAFSRIVDGRIVFEGLHLNEEFIQSLKKIHIIACGSSYHVGMVGKCNLERLLRIPVEVSLASEFRYAEPILDQDDLVIVISQSGETLDTMAAMREASRLGARTLAIVNVVGSSIAKQAHDVLYTWAGPEIAVATTKAYSTQLVLLNMLGIYFADVRGSLAPAEYDRLIRELLELPAKMEQLLEKNGDIQYYASRYFNHESVFFIGRNLDYALSLEGSLKLKEISYIHSEAYAAGELKHGTISLIVPGTLVVAVGTYGKLFDKAMSNVIEVKARGADVLALTTEDRAPEMAKYVDAVLTVPSADDLFLPNLGVVPLQLFAYYVALHRGCDIDKPRNLAKSVTVE
ncbi:MAG: glutamine--fructose-6-phosphate transaminase (isomerizing) [Ruminococcaceae bacterium]|nr:glutamine--fructose-6-phosphate transaminase (isomerizing) [Oscillospiraceae bacterium]